VSDKKVKRPEFASVMLQIVLTLVLAASAYLLAHRDRSAAPCGAPLPDIPVLLSLASENFEDVSIIEKRIPAAYLQFMAPQPDGVMPMRYPLEVVRSNLTLQLPMGATSIPMADDTFYKDSIDSQVVFKFDQQLDFIKLSLPLRESGESVTDFVARSRHDYEQLGASFLPDKDPLELPGMLFQHFEYARPVSFREGEPERDVSHYIYFAPAGVRVLVVDFMTTTERHESARPLVEKIMRSISPGERFLEQMQLEYPQQFGKVVVPTALQQPSGV
jgi:hypothetical protein